MPDKTEDREKEQHKEKVTEKKPAAAQTPPSLLLRINVRLLNRAVSEGDAALVKRVFRKNTEIRKRIDSAALSEAINFYFPEGETTETRSPILQGIKSLPTEPAAMETEEEKPKEKEGKKKEEEAPAASAVTEAAAEQPRTGAPLPEVEAYLHLLVLAKLLMGGEAFAEAALQCATPLIARLAKQSNRRTLDLLRARSYFYYARCYELLGRSSEIRTELLAAHRTACLRFNEVGQATLINLVLRNYVEHDLVDPAIKFASKASFPSHASNNQHVRYLYYMGRLQAIQLDYTDAFAKLMQAIRKAPPESAGMGRGFRIHLHQLATIVQLLMGETPDRAWFSQREFRGPLQPYFELVCAVRSGDVGKFEACCAKHKERFAEDKLLTLVSRLRQSVLKTGLRRINAAYSRIHFSDVAQKLQLESAESAEFVCAKAIRDGVIDGVIDHADNSLRSSDVADVYKSAQPQVAFRKRIEFCLNVHNDAVKAMRYPSDAHKAAADSEKEDKNKKTDEEIAEEIEKELEED